MNIALIVSILAIAIAAANLLMTFWIVPQQKKRQDVRREQDEAISATLEVLLSEPVASARNIIGQGVRRGPGRTTPLRDVPNESKDRAFETNKYLLDMRSSTIGAAFTAMWHLELVQLRIARVACERDEVSRDISSLYHHVDLMAEELRSLLARWSGSIEANRTAEKVNLALDRLPTLIDMSTGNKVAPSLIRLPIKPSATHEVRTQ